MRQLIVLLGICVMLGGCLGTTNVVRTHDCPPTDVVFTVCGPMIAGGCINTGMKKGSLNEDKHFKTWVTPEEHLAIEAEGMKERRRKGGI